MTQQGWKHGNALRAEALLWIRGVRERGAGPRDVQGVFSGITDPPVKRLY